MKKRIKRLFAAALTAAMLLSVNAFAANDDYGEASGSMDASVRMEGAEAANVIKLVLPTIESNSARTDIFNFVLDPNGFVEDTNGERYLDDEITSIDIEKGAHLFFKNNVVTETPAVGAENTSVAGFPAYTHTVAGSDVTVDVFYEGGQWVKADGSAYAPLANVGAPASITLADEGLTDTQSNGNVATTIQILWGDSQGNGSDEWEELDGTAITGITVNADSDGTDTLAAAGLVAAGTTSATIKNSSNNDAAIYNYTTTKTSNKYTYSGTGEDVVTTVYWDATNSKFVAADATAYSALSSLTAITDEDALETAGVAVKTESESKIGFSSTSDKIKIINKSNVAVNLELEAIVEPTTETDENGQEKDKFYTFVDSKADLDTAESAALYLALGLNTGKKGADGKPIADTLVAVKKDTKSVVKMATKVDDNGDPVLDNGEPVYEEVKDADGKTVYEEVDATFATLKASIDAPKTGAYKKTWDKTAGTYVNKITEDASKNEDAYFATVEFYMTGDVNANSDWDDFGFDTTMNVKYTFSKAEEKQDGEDGNNQQQESADVDPSIKSYQLATAVSATSGDAQTYSTYVIDFGKGEKAMTKFVNISGTGANGSAYTWNTSNVNVNFDEATSTLTVRAINNIYNGTGWKINLANDSDGTFSIEIGDVKTAPTT